MILGILANKDKSFKLQLAGGLVYIEQQPKIASCSEEFEYLPGSLIVIIHQLLPAEMGCDFHCLGMSAPGFQLVATPDKRLPCISSK
jgi:hypothetical protein